MRLQLLVLTQTQALHLRGLTDVAQRLFAVWRGELMKSPDEVFPIFFFFFSQMLNYIIAR